MAQTAKLGSTPGQSSYEVTLRESRIVHPLHTHTVTGRRERPRSLPWCFRGARLNLSPSYTRLPFARSYRGMGLSLSALCRQCTRSKRCGSRPPFWLLTGTRSEQGVEWSTQETLFCCLVFRVDATDDGPRVSPNALLNYSFTNITSSHRITPRSRWPEARGV